MKWDDIEFFDLREFDSPDQPGSAEAMDLAFVALLDEVRKLAGVPILITSGLRTFAHNQRIGGAWNSLHLSGHAADFYSRRMKLPELYLLCERIGFSGLGAYPDTSPPVIHADNRTSAPRRWVRRNGIYTYLW